MPAIAPSPHQRRVGDDLNANGYIDAKDLLSDSRWVDGTDSDRDGYKDDLFGWNFVANTNDPFDDNGHGTHTAGTIGALGDNGVGVAGVNWSVQIMPLKFLDSGGSGSYANAVKAINYATWMSSNYTVQQGATIKGANVRLTSNSWSGSSTSATLSNAITKSGNANMLFVAAAGNSGAIPTSRPSTRPHTPRTTSSPWPPRTPTTCWHRSPTGGQRP